MADQVDDQDERGDRRLDEDHGRSEQAAHNPHHQKRGQHHRHLRPGENVAGAVDGPHRQGDQLPVDHGVDQRGQAPGDHDRGSSRLG